MKKVNRYVLVQGEEPAVFAGLVESMIMAGWQPQGGVNHVWRTYESDEMQEIHHMYTQALVGHGSTEK